MATRPLRLSFDSSVRAASKFETPGFIYHDILDTLSDIASQPIDGDALPESEQGPGLTGADLEEFLAFAAKPENTWVRGAGSPAKFIETKFASFIERGLSRANISAAQPGLIGAYAREISDDRHPERKVKGLITRPVRRPPGAPAPLSIRPVAELTPEQLEARRARGRIHARTFREKHFRNG